MNSNRPEGLPTAKAWILFWIGVSALLLDVALYQHMLLEVLR